METILVKLFNRAKKLYHHQNLDNCNLPQGIITLFNDEQMTVKSYLNLDDVDIWKLIKDWRMSNDPVLSELAAAFTERKKFQKLIQADKKEIKKLKEELNQILANSKLKSVEEGYFWLENQVEDSFYNELYQEEEGKIRILNKDGSLEDFRNVSEIISRSHKQPDNKKQVYVNFDLLAEEICDKRVVQQLKDKLKEKWIKNK